MNIKPLNGHVLIEPLKHKSFVTTGKDSFEEVGIIIDYDADFEEAFGERNIRKGDKIFFDSWLALKYPTGKDEEFFWLVKWEDVRAIEHAN